MTWKEAKEELLAFGYQEGKEYLVQHENDSELSLIVEGNLQELTTFVDVLESYDLVADAASARIVITRDTSDKRTEEGKQ